MKYKKWTEEEVIFLKTNYEYMHIKEIATKLQRNCSSITNKAHVLGLSKEKSKKHMWTIKEREYVIKSYQDLNQDIDSIAETIGISKTALWTYANKVLKIKRFPEEIRVRKCSMCKNVLPIAMFSKSKNKKYGHCHICKNCESQRLKKYYYAKKQGG